MQDIIAKLTAKDDNLITALDLIPGALQQLQQLLKALGLLCQCFINGIADTLPVGGLLLIA